ncbi:hypothetical protein OH807_15870 [Kitasatospora sp. NBC_01560]|uniref:hypothetical protein n=1 Tax=Kitasatospora sp. NBC_01560 TaxID=2975965 RepID=UPI003866B4C4
MVSLITGEVESISEVMGRAAEDCQAAGPPAGLCDAVTLGNLARRWAEIAEQDLHCTVVNVHGDRLYAVTLTMEAWGQTCAWVTSRAMDLMVRAHGGAAVQQDADLQRGRDLLSLVTRIKEQIGAR